MLIAIVIINNDMPIDSIVTPYQNVMVTFFLMKYGYIFPNEIWVHNITLIIITNNAIIGSVVRISFETLCIILKITINDNAS